MTRAGGSRSPLRRGYADGPFGQVHFHDGGEGRPLILLHQAPLDGRQFEAVAPLLAIRGFRAIAIDLPGCGESDAPDAAPTILDYAEAVPAVMDRLGLAVCDVLGHHTGSLVATEVALAYPSRVGRLILNGPVPLSDAERSAFLQDVEVREKGFTVQEDGSHLSTLFAGRAAYVGGSVPLERVNQYILWTLSGRAPFWWGHHAAFTYDHEPRLLRITHPTLILTNTGDAIFEQAKRCKSLRPDFELRVIEGGGIDIQDQRPEAWTSAVVAFLEPSNLASVSA